MSQPSNRPLSGVAETLLITLYVRAMESQRADALLRDEQAVALVQRMDQELAHVKQIKMDEDDKTVLILRTREFDRRVRDFLARDPRSNIVHIGCGLNSRFARVDNGQVYWYDLDLPHVIERRRQLLGGETARYHLLGCSALDPAWLETLQTERDRPFLFLAEGVFTYFEPAQVKALVLALQEYFPGAELVFDASLPYMVWMNNLRFAIGKFGARYHWGLGRARDLEKWADGICLLDEWFPFDDPEPRLAHVQWMRHIPFLAHVIGIFHYRLGLPED